MNHSALMMNQLELPPDFIHEPPKGYHYEVETFDVMFVAFALSMITFYTDVFLSPSGDSMILKREGIQRLLTGPSVEISRHQRHSSIYCNAVKSQSFDGSISMMYEPRLNDYVSWRNVEGWVYYVDDTHFTIEIRCQTKRG